MDTLSPQQRDRLQQLLRPGEEVRWVGRPDPRKMFARGDVFLVPFSLVWCGFAVFWTIGATVQGGLGWFPLLWGSMFVLIGLYFVVGRFVVKARRKAGRAYVLTDRRAIVLKPSGEETQALAQASISTHRDRDGSHAQVRFTSSGFASGIYENSGMEIFSVWGTPFAFYDVADADGLLAAVRDLD